MQTITNETKSTHATGDRQLSSFHSGYVRGLTVTLSLIALNLSPIALQVSDAAQFTPPKLDGFNLHDEREADGDGDGANETHVRHYLNQNGDSIFSMTTRGYLWAWSLDTRGEDSGTSNYVIRDSNCDGVFDEVYSLDDEYHIPECLK